jgi:siderophore synthetase component
MNNNSKKIKSLNFLDLNKLLPQLIKEGYFSEDDYEKLLNKSNDYSRKQVRQIFTLVKAEKKELIKIIKFFNRSHKYLCLSYEGFKLISPQSVTKNGELLEQFCWSGHNIYPFPKIIDELMIDEKEIYITREVNNLSVAIIKKNLIVFNSLRYKSYNNFLEKRFPYLLKQIKKRISLKDDETIIPIHAFQLNHDPFLKRLENKKKIQMITLPYKHFLLTSTRTIYALNDNICIKLPINIHITSDKRLIFQSYSHNAPIFAQIIKDIIAKEESIRSTFLIAEDIASVRIDDYYMAKHLCAIFREPALINKNTYPANYLFEICNLKNNKRVLQELFHHKLGNKKELLNAFFEKYIKVIIQAPLILHVKYGIGTEPHLQNSFIMFDDNFMPIKLILRDIDGININMSVLSQKLDLTDYNFHVLTRFMFKSDQFSNIRLWDSLILFHIQELINILTDNYHFSSEQLWQQVVKEIKLTLYKLSFDPNNNERINMFKKHFFSELVPTRAFVIMKVSNSESFMTTDMRNFLYIK